MEKCIVKKLKAEVNSDVFRKGGELRLNAISNGDVTLRCRYGAVTIDLISGSMTYNGEQTSHVELAQSMETYYVVTLTSGTKIAIGNKYGLSVISSGIAELTDGDTIESLYYSAFEQIQLKGSTSGSISGLDTTRLALLNLEDTLADGSIDIFANSNVISNIKIQNTKITGNLHNMLGKSLESSCHWSNSDIYVNVEDIPNMSNGNTSFSKYINTHLYGDMSKVPASMSSIDAQTQANKVEEFTWETQRHTVSGAKIIGNYTSIGLAFINYGTYLDAMLIDQAQCEAGSNKNIQVYGVHTENSGWEAAVATLKTKGYTVKINGVTL